LEKQKKRGGCSRWRISEEKKIGETEESLLVGEGRRETNWVKLHKKDL